MPIYTYACKRGHIHDELLKYPPPETVKCDKCRCKAGRLVTMPAKTAGRWGDTTAKFIPAFGKEMTSSQAAIEAKKRGLIHEADLPPHFIDDRLAKQDAEAAEHNKTMELFKQNKAANGGDASIAWADTFSVENMTKSGTFKE